MVIPYDSERAAFAWKAFVEKHTILDDVDSLIAKSWQRCYLRLNPRQNAGLSKLNSNNLLAAQVASFDLISIARPVMEDIYQYIEDTDLAIVLVNSTGYILDIIGNDLILEFIGQMGITTGTLISEAQIGTNAFALALSERIPLQVTGSEHFLEYFHQLTDTAAPIFDLTGHPLGAIGTIGFVFQKYTLSLGLVLAAARAIEAQRQSDLLLADLNKQLAGLNEILSSISDGIMVWNSERVLIHINKAATDILDLPPRAVMGQSIGDLINAQEFITDALDRKEPITNVDVTFNLGEHSARCILSLRFVESVNKELQWIIATLKPEKEVRQLFHNQYGIQAYSTMSDILGESTQMVSVRRMVKQAAPARASILIRGEYGTGKTQLVAAVHNESPRREGPFLIFPCSSIPRRLTVSELVGYDAGFSSGRPGGQPSKFELAHSGTLFLQNVDALSLEAQALLLNVLDLGVVLRLGSDHPIPVDVRVIASSSANLEKLIEHGSFLSDLYYRLSSFEINIPPLRQRTKDIPLHVVALLANLSQQLNTPIQLEEGVMEVLKNYSWPGNLRELETVCNRAAIQADGRGVIGLAHLPNFILYPEPHSGNGGNSQTIARLEEIEENAILQAAVYYKGNVSRMANALGIGRTTLWRKLKELEISPESYRQTPAADL